jgi:hypothetical protein
MSSYGKDENAPCRCLSSLECKVAHHAPTKEGENVNLESALGLRRITCIPNEITRVKKN